MRRLLPGFAAPVKGRDRKKKRRKGRDTGGKRSHRYGHIPRKERHEDRQTRISQKQKDKDWGREKNNQLTNDTKADIHQFNKAVNIQMAPITAWV